MGFIWGLQRENNNGYNIFSIFYFFHTRDDFNIKVLQAFVELHEFADLNLVQALRWAERFCEQTCRRLHHPCHVHSERWHHVIFMPLLFLDSQAVPVEFPFAWWSPKDRPHDGGVCLPLLPVQPGSLPVDRWAGFCYVMWITPSLPPPKRSSSLKPDHPAEIRTDTARACKLHREKPEFTFVNQISTI